MLRKFITAFLVVAAVGLSAQERSVSGVPGEPGSEKTFRRGRGGRPGDFRGKQFGKPDQTGTKHPLLSVLENGDFTPEERAGLKALAEKDPKAFGVEMRKRFLLRRKQEAQTALALREAVLKAKSPEEKEQAKAKLRAELEKRAGRRLEVHKKVLDETEKNIRALQSRYEKLRTEYEKRVAGKKARVEEEMGQILAPEPPRYLLDAANLDPEKPQPRWGQEKGSR